MKMPEKSSEGVQWILQTMVAGSEEVSPISFMAVSPKNKEDAHRYWQEGVDMIYRLLESGILKFSEYTDHNSSVIRRSIELARALASVNPFDESVRAKDLLHWHAIFLGATDVCKALMRKHGIDNFETPLCIAFIEELENLFEEAGVTWSPDPLIPVGGFNH